MKNKFKIPVLLLSVYALLACCTTESTDNPTPNPTNSMNLYKRIIYHTNSTTPTLNTKEIQHFVNNEIVADTVFNHLNQWTARKTITTNGTTKTFQTFDNTNQLIAQREENYDSQGRIISRRELPPSNNVLTVNYAYNTDGSITVNGTNTLDSTVSYIGTYYKNADGLIYKESRPITANPSTNVESTLLFDGSRPTSLINNVNSNVIAFDYYPNPKPANILKSNLELNNRILYAVSMLKLAEEGNFYYKRNDTSSANGSSTYQTDFNANNYIDHYKLTYVSIPNNSSSSTEIFYYYN